MQKLSLEAQRHLHVPKVESHVMGLTTKAWSSRLLAKRRPTMLQLGGLISSTWPLSTFVAYCTALPAMLLLLVLLLLRLLVLLLLPPLLLLLGY
jgi:hypothetical protein